MIKVGFIDYYLDEWHANNYPEFIKKSSNGRYEVCYAYGKIDSPIGGLTNEEWAQKYGVELLDSIEEVCQKSDVCVVLSPDNPEMHEELTAEVFKSGKLVYIDKTFAPDKATAIRIFENAKQNNVKCFSSSALRFSAELENINKNEISRIYSRGPGVYEIYSIHQIEPIISLMNSRAKRVMATGDMKAPALVIEFECGRFAHMYQCAELGFELTVADKENTAKAYSIESDFFALFIDAMIKFFDTGETPVTPEQTIDVIAVREAGIKALENPFVWVEV